MAGLQPERYPGTTRTIPRRTPGLYALFFVSVGPGSAVSKQNRTPERRRGRSLVHAGEVEAVDRDGTAVSRSGCHTADELLRSPLERARGPRGGARRSDWRDSRSHRAIGIADHAAGRPHLRAALVSAGVWGVRKDGAIVHSAGQESGGHRTPEKTAEENRKAESQFECGRSAPLFGHHS